MFYCFSIYRQGLKFKFIYIKKAILKLIIFILCPILPFLSFSQNLESAKEGNTVFILYEGIDKENVKKVMKVNPGSPEKSYIIYHFNFFKKNHKIDPNVSFQLIFKGINVLSNDKMDEPIFTLVNKSFIRKNKDVVLTKYLMNDMNKNSLRALLKNAKTIFLIDKKEIKNKKVPLKEVKLETMGIE